MGYFNYFVKCFIRIFTKKYFKHLLLFLIIFIGFILFNNSNVFAANYTLDTNYFSTTDINNAKNICGSIWDNEDYDIFLGYKVPWGRKVVMYYNAKNAFDVRQDLYYRLDEPVSGRCYFDLYSSDDFFRSPNSNLNSKQLGLPSGSPVDTYTNLFEMDTIRSDNSYKILPIRSHFDIYYKDKQYKIADRTTQFVVSPYFITSDSDLQTFNFDYLQISGGSTKYTTTFLDTTYYAKFTLKYIYNGVTTYIDILDNYITYDSSLNTWQINIPYYALTNSIIVRNGATFRFVLDYSLQYETGYSITTNELTYNLTTEEEETINNESDKQLQSQILDATQQTNNKLDNLDNSINQTNESINNLDNSINNSNVNDLTSNSLPSDTTNDITSEGVNGIFQSIYNAFCVGQPQDIVFPFPFTNQSIVLSPSYVRNALTNSNASFIITLIQAFWWYIISRFIIKDVMNKINKIKSGNIEDIEKTNIRGDML